MTTIYQSTPVKNLSNKRCIHFSLKGNGQFGNVFRSGWSEAKLTDNQKKAIESALKKSDVDKVYKRGTKVYSFGVDGTERCIA